MLRRAPLFLPLLLLSCCTDPIGAKRVLREQGFREIHISGYRGDACDEDDDYRTGFLAINPNGLPMSGVVCRKWEDRVGKVRVD
jgi:hypothetical protein